MKNTLFIINRKEEYGGQIVYHDFDSVKDDFKNLILHPMDFKLGIIDSLEDIIKPIRNAFESDELKIILQNAYPK